MDWRRQWSLARDAGCGVESHAQSARRIKSANDSAAASTPRPGNPLRGSKLDPPCELESQPPEPVWSAAVIDDLKLRHFEAVRGAVSALSGMRRERPCVVLMAAETWGCTRSDNPAIVECKNEKRRAASVRELGG